MISRFCSSLWVDFNSSFQISIIHDNFDLGSILGPKVTVETLSTGPEKLKFSKCYISNQISGEAYLWLLWILYGLIFSQNTPQSYLFMNQSDFMLFLGLWFWSIQALPNFARSFPNFGILFPNSPNVYKKAIQGIFNSRNLFFSLTLNLPLDSSPCFNTENNEFHKKTLSNLVFGDDFTSTRTTWMYHDLFYVLISKFQSKEVNIMF